MPEIEFTGDDIPLPERRAEWQGMIDSLQEHARTELSSWERGFLDSIEAHLAGQGFLTPKQGETLNSLHPKHLE